ncbi:MAG: hypothetical protein ACRDWE_13780 [Acidimicrobiales bacterium]
MSDVATDTLEDPLRAGVGDSVGYATRERRGAFRWRGHPHLGAFCVFALVIGGIYSQVLDGTRSLITNGPWSQPLFVVDALAGGPATAPLTHLAASAWLHLHLPIVDPFQGYGIPLLADQGVPVYPPEVFAHLLFTGNYSAWLVINLVALAFGVYLLARAFGQGFFAAIAAGFVVALAGAAPPNVNMSMLNPLAVLPFVLLAVRYAVDPISEHRRVALLGVATSVALLGLSGFQEVLPLAAVVILVFTVALVVHYRTWERAPRSIVATAGSAVAGAVTGCVGFLPTLPLVHGGTSLNGPASYLAHVPTYWLTTLFFPTITGRSLNQAPADLGNTVGTLGMPLLVLVVVLALVLSLRRAGASTRFYVFPSVVLVVFGVLAYADVGHVLQVMDLPLFDRIRSDRFLQFAWWIPVCLLLGAVISNARALKLRDLGLGLVVAGAIDAYFYERFVHALAADHVATTSAVTHAPIVVGAVVVAFVAAIVAVRVLGPAAAGFAMTAVVLASCVYALPTNFAPSAYGGAVRSVSVPGYTGARGDQLVYFGDRQLPTTQYSVQIYGPLVPQSYAGVTNGLFSAAETGGLGPLYGAVSTLAEVTLTPRALSVLRSLGVDLLVLPAPLSATGFTAVPVCGSASAGTHELVCSLGVAPSAAPSVGYAPQTVYSYRLIGADALVQHASSLVTVGSDSGAIARLSSGLSTAVAAVPSTAYVTTSALHLRAAQGVRGVSRHATTEQVSIVVHAARAGIAVLRGAYSDGMHATVDGRSVQVLPVDGGLWSAVPVGAGTSRVVLHYATTAGLVEFGLGAAGLSLLVLWWIAEAVSGVLRRRGRRRRRPTVRSAIDAYRSVLARVPSGGADAP